MQMGKQKRICTILKISIIVLKQIIFILTYFYTVVSTILIKFSDRKNMYYQGTSRYLAF